MKPITIAALLVLGLGTWHLFARPSKAVAPIGKGLLVAVNVNLLGGSVGLPDAALRYGPLAEFQMQVESSDTSITTGMITAIRTMSGETRRLSPSAGPVAVPTAACEPLPSVSF